MRLYDSANFEIISCGWVIFPLVVHRLVKPVGIVGPDPGGAGEPVIARQSGLA
jgi:hypothetical protein